MSIHADSYRDSTATGATVYVLNEKGATDEAALLLARRENASDLIGGVSLADTDQTLARVLLDLSQNAALSASTAAGQRLIKKMSAVTPMRRMQVQQAPFLVLKSPDIPSVLVETAYISNPREEASLRNPQYQASLARALREGIVDYFTANPPQGSYFAHTRAFAADAASCRARRDSIGDRRALPHQHRDLAAVEQFEDRLRLRRPGAHDPVRLRPRGVPRRRAALLYTRAFRRSGPSAPQRISQGRIGGHPSSAVAADRSNRRGRGRREARVGREGARREFARRGRALDRRRDRGRRIALDSRDRRRRRDRGGRARARIVAPRDEQDREPRRPREARDAWVPGRGAAEHRLGRADADHVAGCGRRARLERHVRGRGDRRQEAGPARVRHDDRGSRPLLQHARAAQVPALGQDRSRSRRGDAAQPRARPFRRAARFHEQRADGVEAGGRA